MRVLYLLIIWGFTIPLFAQHATITIGRGTNCFGRGACTIQAKESNVTSKTANAYIHSVKENKVVLRVLRSKLTTDESDRIFGESINATNIGELKFIMDQSVLLPVSLQQYVLKRYGKKINSLSTGVYDTKVSEEYIDITLFKK